MALYKLMVSCKSSSSFFILCKLNKDDKKIIIKLQRPLQPLPTKPMRDSAIINDSGQIGQNKTTITRGLASSH
jgi:hypothetical protein